MAVAGQRRFQVLGDNTFKIAHKLMSSQRLCRLLKYSVRDPFNDKKYSDVDGIDLLNKQIMIIPKPFDDSTEKMSYVVTYFSYFSTNSFNQDYKLDTIRFVIACPFDEWVLDEQSLRPYLIMQEIDNIFNGAQISGIGTLKFQFGEIVNLTPQLGGYALTYQVNEFN